MAVRALLTVGLILPVAGFSLLGAGGARAQPPVSGPTPAYEPTPPVKGALYQDGPTDRYLLDGAWLQRPDTSDVGLAQGWWQNVASTAGWSPVTIPNAYNAGNFSS